VNSGNNNSAAEQSSDLAVSSSLIPAFDPSSSLQVEKLYRAGEFIMSQGDIGDSAYFIQSGRVQISLTRSDGSKLLMGQRGAGSLIGEMAIVDDGPRSASVQAIEDCRLLEITKSDFTRALRNSSPIVGLVTRLILLRYRDVLQRSDIIRDFTGMATVLEQQERVHAEESRVLDLVRMANEFRVAAARQQLLLEYQPFIDMTTGAVIGFEALMRWQHPVRGKIGPDQFIPMAEDTGLIVDATRWAFKEACTALKRIQDRTGNRALFMSINFSATDFDEPDLFDYLISTLAETGVTAESVHLEITERLLLRKSEQVLRMLQQCRAQGMQVAIDDFGIAYSSLSYLHLYPVSILKIDYSFIKNMISDRTSMSLVKTILSLCSNMGFKSIAEGVETQDQVDLLLELECTVAQGYRFAKPMSEQALMKFLEQGHG